MTIDVNFRTKDRKDRLASRLKIEKLDSSHKHSRSAMAFADIHGPVFHLSTGDDELGGEVDVCFEIPISDNVCAHSMVPLKLSNEDGEWEVVPLQLPATSDHKVQIDSAVPTSADASAMEAESKEFNVEKAQPKLASKQPSSYKSALVPSQRSTPNLSSKQISSFHPYFADGKWFQT